MKFVIQDRADFDYACDVVRRHDLVARSRAVLFSPVHGVLAPDVLARGFSRRGLAGPPAAPGAQVHLEPGHAGRLMAPRAVVLLSGGLDSATAAALARREGLRCTG